MALCDGTQRMHLYLHHRPRTENLVCNALGPFNSGNYGKQPLKNEKKLEKDQSPLSKQLSTPPLLLSFTVTL